MLLAFDFCGRVTGGRGSGLAGAVLAVAVGSVRGLCALLRLLLAQLLEVILDQPPVVPGPVVIWGQCEGMFIGLERGVVFAGHGQGGTAIEVVGWLLGL